MTTVNFSFGNTMGIPSTGCVEYLYIEKELIPTVWMVKLILVHNAFLHLFRSFLCVCLTAWQQQAMYATQTAC